MLNSLTIHTNDLYIGMFVSGLDRPWLETPFLTQGFLIESTDDINRLRKYCEFVQVDRRRSRYRAVELTLKESKTSKRSARERKLDGRPRLGPERIFPSRPIKPYQDDGDWEDEHPRAQKALDTMVNDIDEIFTEVSQGGNIDLLKLKNSVSPIVDSISRNPDACLWISRLKQHDKYTYQHSLSAAIWSVSLGRQMGLPKRDLRSLAMGCMLMDVGKLRVDPELLQAERSLSLEETAQMASHISYGLEILEESRILNQDVIDMVAHHHERFDGSGYPNGLHQDQIPPFARIAAIVDTYDAITSHRGYAEAISPPDAIAILYKSRDLDFQAELVEAFIQAIGIYPAGTLVELSTGEVGVVVAEYRARRLRPKIMVLLDADKNKLDESKLVDLQDQPDSDQSQPLRITKGLDPKAYGIDLSTIDT